MSPLFAAALAVHVVAGTAAIAAGALPIFAAKRRGGTHARFGRLFARCMIFVLASAALMSALALNPYFTALTVTATTTVFSGVRVLRRKRPDIDPAQRATRLDWLVTASLFAAACALMGLAVAGRFTQGNPVVVYSLAGGAMAYSGYDLYRFARPAAWPFFPRLWFYEHLVKMLGAYSAVVGAFSGSVAMTFLPDPWKQLWSTILFQLLTVGFILYYARKRRSRAETPALAAA
jgi:hypothetical protein